MDDAPWLRDAWYPVALTGDLTGTRPVSLDLLGQPLVLFRGRDGAPQCLSDRCPHRSTPLSGGRVVDGQLECPYHGWRFGAGGACQRIPTLGAGEPIPALAHAQDHPIAEVDGLLWVFVGNPDLADVDAIVRHPELSDPGWTSVDMWFDFDLEHDLLIENLLDPSHLPFTHHRTLSRRRDAQPLDVKVESFEGGFRGTARKTRGQGASAGSFTFLGPHTVRLDLSSERAGFVQIHHCVPLSRDPNHPRVRLFSRMVRNGFLRVPGAAALTRLGSRVILWQDLGMLRGQQSRLAQGAKPWACPVAADRIALEYRRWREHEGR
jgi:phenylpropionate dioxygenase-like ring-hydroxylating dioxygenase large terminal subunit